MSELTPGWQDGRLATPQAVELDDTQEFDSVDYTEPEPEDIEPASPAPSPYDEDPEAAAGPQDEAPGA